MAHQDLRGSLYAINLDQQDVADEFQVRIEAIMAEIADEAGIGSTDTFITTDDGRFHGTLIYDKFKHHGR